MTEPNYSEFVQAYREIREEREELRAEVERWRTRATEAEAKLNTPHTVDFLFAVSAEAAHQRDRWGTEHDDGKTDANWYWLLGHLAGKAVHATNNEKRLHHIITTAAACLNWHSHRTGADTRMRPGIGHCRDCDVSFGCWATGIGCQKTVQHG